jgi:hypothetical protein
MSATDIVKADDALPRIKSVRPVGNHSVTVEWSSGHRAGTIETVDLAPQLLTYKIYRPLRDDADLFGTVHIAAGGSMIAWGEDDGIDIGAATVERLAEEVMTNEDFAAFLARNNLSLDRAAGQLGISRRLVAYYAKNRPVPRYIALACRYLEFTGNQDVEPELGGVRFVLRGVADEIYSSGQWRGGDLTHMMVAVPAGQRATRPPPAHRRKPK